MWLLKFKFAKHIFNIIIAFAYQQLINMFTFQIQTQKDARKLNFKSHHILIFIHELKKNNMKCALG